MTLTAIVVLILIIALVGALPVFPYSRTYGYAPSGGLGALVIIVLLFWFLRHGI